MDQLGLNGYLSLDVLHLAWLVNSQLLVDLNGHLLIIVLVVSHPDSPICTLTQLPIDLVVLEEGGVFELDTRVAKELPLHIRSSHLLNLLFLDLQFVNEGRDSLVLH